LLQIRDPRFNKVEQASQSLEASNALEAVAGALYDEDECRFEHWAKEIFGKLVDLAYDIDLEKSALFCPMPEFRTEFHHTGNGGRPPRRSSD